MGKIWKGNELIYSSFKKSYLITTDNEYFEFDINSTPVARLSSASNDYYIPLPNNNSIYCRHIKEIQIGDSYADVTSLSGSGLLYGFSNVEKINILSLGRVKHLSDYTLGSNRVLKTIDISGMVSLDRGGMSIFINNDSLEVLKMGAIVPPAFQSIGGLPALKTILVPESAVSAYKTTVPWRWHASKIVGY